jgi:hypothetical protein
LSETTRLTTIINFVLVTITKDSNVNLQLTASGVLLHLRNYLCSTSSTKKIIAYVMLTLKALAKADRAKDANAIDTTCERFGIVLLTMMHTDEQVVEMIKEKDYESLRNVIRNGSLANAIIATVDNLDLDPSKVSRDELIRLLSE